MSTQRGSTPAEIYENYLGPAIAHPWTRVLLEYAVPRSDERVLDIAWQGTSRPWSARMGKSSHSM